MGVDWFAMIFGLGFVLSFGYWCTNFLVVQRAMAAKNMTAARNTRSSPPCRNFFPFLVIVPRHDRRRALHVAGQRLPHSAADHFAGKLRQRDWRCKKRRLPDADAVKAVGDALAKGGR